MKQRKAVTILGGCTSTVTARPWDGEPSHTEKQLKKRRETILFDDEIHVFMTSKSSAKLPAAICNKTPQQPCLICTIGKGICKMICM
jgi:hypothetical protein